MPNLRLTDQEASDIASYLLANKNDEFDATPVPNVNEEVLNEISSDFLSFFISFIWPVWISRSILLHTKLKLTIVWSFTS